MVRQFTGWACGNFQLLEPRSKSALICKLDIKPHPEGGSHREIYRSSARANGCGARSAITALYAAAAEADQSLESEVQESCGDEALATG
jgi:predicted cupin superfamily sugar epimerase